MLLYNYKKQGKGVNKRDPNQPRIQVFFDILPRKLWELFKLNLLYVITIIPFFVVTMVTAGVLSSEIIDFVAGQLGADVTDSSLVTYDLIIRAILAFCFTAFFGQGPVTAGLTYIAREYGKEKYCWLVSDFFETIKRNFKQGMVLWIIDLLFFYVAVVASIFYIKLKMAVLTYIIILIAIIYIMAHTYIYQMMITFDLPLKHILKNSLLIALGKAPKSILIFMLLALTYIIIPVFVLLKATSIFTMIVVLLIEILLLPALTSFTTNYYIASILEKYINIENS